jgi:hypothetical protein
MRHPRADAGRIGSFVSGSSLAFPTNEEIVAWSGQNSAPVVAWQNEPPINRWIDILHLAERLAPEPALIPEDVWDRISRQV